jgi:hypothetical protein
MSAPNLIEVLTLVRDYVMANCPGEIPSEMIVKLVSGKRLRVPLPPPGLPAPRPPPEGGNSAPPARP